MSKPKPNFSWAVRYSPDDGDVVIFECFEPECSHGYEQQHALAEAQLRDYLTERYQSYGNQTFTTWALAEPVEYEVVTTAHVRKTKP